MIMKECSCNVCKNACNYSPGWFKPEQIPIILKHFKVKTIRDLLGKDRFAINWWVGDHENILVLAPNIVGNSDIEYPADPRGPCVFYKDGKCEIYSVRPFECAKYIHSESSKIIRDRHFKISQEWEASNLLDEFEDEIECEEMTFSPFSFF